MPADVAALRQADFLVSAAYEETGYSVNGNTFIIIILCLHASQP